MGNAQPPAKPGVLDGAVGSRPQQLHVLLARWSLSVQLLHDGPGWEIANANN